MLALAAALFVVAAASTGRAQQQTVGFVQAVVDGAARQWVSLRIDGKTISVFQRPAPGVTAFTVQGNLGGGAALDQDVITLEFATLGEPLPATVHPGASAVVYFPSGLFPHYASEDGVASVELAEISVWDDRAFVRGAFRATLQRIDDFDAAPDPADSIEIEGEFATELDLFVPRATR